MAKKKYYAYYIEDGDVFGIVDSWPACQEITKGHKSRYKSFSSESDAKAWLDSGANYEKKKDKFYAYYIIESKKGAVVTDWDRCKQITQQNRCRYKSFDSEKEAKEWLDAGAVYESKQNVEAKLLEAIYFDAGTGRGIGTEVRVTDKYGNSLIDKIVPNDKVNEHGNYLTKEGSTNNFGELLGLFIALKLSLETENKLIMGDSKLVIDFWSKGRIKSDIAEETKELAQKVLKLRTKFENLGGKIEHISGDINPADLGFHR